jgi:hypothetical protein
MSWLEGKKTYIVSFVTIVYAVTGLIIGQVTQEAAIILILGACGLGALRNAVK